MLRLTWRRGSVALFASLLALSACSNSSTDTPDGGGPAAGGQIQVTASGEPLAQEGFGFPPAAADEPYFVDGWEVKINRLLVTFDKVTVSEGPDTSSGDQTQTGPVVAEATGPWAVDLSKGGDVTGKEGEKAVALTVIANQNKNGNKPFDAATKYAFGFSVVEASAGAKRVNIDASDADYAEMVAKKQTVLYVGTATFKGTTCTPSGNAGLDGLPKTVNFRFGFAKPTTYLNCLNPDLGEDTRGIQVKSNEPVVAQLTIHPDHPFWDAFEEDAPLRFDHLALIASKKVTAGGAAPTITLDDAKGIALAPVTVGGTNVAARVCEPGTGTSTGDLVIDAKGQAIADLEAFMTGLVETQGHLNADGLCAVQGK